MNHQDVLAECKKIYEADVTISDLTARLSNAITNKQKIQIQSLIETYKGLQKRSIGRNGINLPLFIKQQYDFLYDEMIYNGEVYGGFYQIKDILEILIKLPTLIFVEGISKYIISDNVDVFDEHSDGKEQLTIAKELLEDLLKKAPSLGDWEQLAQKLKKRNIMDIPVPNQAKPLYEKIRRTIERIDIIFSSKFAKVEISKDLSDRTPTEDASDTNIKVLDMQFSAYRNVKIGHGATSLKIQELFGDFKYFLGILNSILDNSGYEGIEFIENGQELIIKDTENPISISVVPFVKEKLEIESQQQRSVISMMESYFGKKKVAYLLNYNTGRIEESNLLYQTLQQVSTKLSIPFVSTGGMRNSKIHSNDFSSTFDTIPFAEDNEIFRTAVSDWIKECEENGERKGILFLQAERGMGKSVFARMYTHENSKLIKKGKGVTKAILDGKDKNILIWSYFINDTFSSPIGSFKKQMFDFFTNWFAQPQYTQYFSYKNDNYVKARNELEIAIDNSTARDLSSGQYRVEIPSEITVSEHQKYVLRPLNEVWKKYFKELAKKIHEVNRKQKILFIVDGVDELDLTQNDCLHFEKFINQDTLPENMYFLFLGRLESELHNTKPCVVCEQNSNSEKAVTVYQNLKRIATKQLILKRFNDVGNNVYHDTLKNFVINSFGLSEENSLKNNKKNHSNVTNDNLLKPNIDIDKLLIVAEYRFVYITALLKIYLADPDNFKNNLLNLNNKTSSYVETYIKSLSLIGRKFQDAIRRLLLVLHLLKKQPVTREELSYLVLNYDADMPDFQINFLLQNAGMITDKRSAQGNTYSLDHEIWNNELSINDSLDSVKNELQKRAEAVARKQLRLPYTKNWTVLICYFLDEELYCEKSIVENILSFINVAENDYDVYVQARIVKILKTIADKNNDLPKEVVYIVKNQLAQSYFNCGRYYDGTTLIVSLEKNIKTDNRIDNAIKALTYYNLGNYWERFEIIHNDIPFSSKNAYAQALKLLEETNSNSLYYDFNRIICLLKLGEKEIVTGSLKTADSYLNKAELIAHNSTGINKMRQLPLYINVNLIILRLIRNNSSHSTLNKNYIENMNKFLELEQDDYLVLKDNTTDILFKPTTWSKKKLDLKVNQIIAEEYQQQSNYEEASKYIEQAISLANEMAYLSSIQGVFFEKREVIPLKILKLKINIYATKTNNNGKSIIHNIKDLEEEINNDITYEQKTNGDYAWLNEQIDEVNNLKTLVKSDFSKDIQIITNNLILADKQGYLSDTRYKYYMKALQIAAKCLKLEIDAFNIDYNNELQRNPLQATIQNICLSNENNQKLLGLLIKACSEVAITIYDKEKNAETSSNSLESIIKYNNIVMISLETILKNYMLLKTELKPTEYSLKTRLAESYQFMAECSREISYIDKAIDLLVSTQNERNQEYSDLVESSKYLKPKLYSYGKFCHETDAFFSEKEEIIQKDNNQEILLGPPSSVLADAYKTKADMMMDSDYIENNTIINVLDLAIKQYHIINNTANTVSNYRWHDFHNFDLAYCYFYKGDLLIAEGENVESGNCNRNCESLFDLDSLRNARFCLEKALYYLHVYNDDTKNPYFNMAELYIKLCYIKLCYICTTKFQIEDNNDVAYDYLNKYLTASQKNTKSKMYDNTIFKEYENVLKTLYFSLMDEKAALEEKMANEKMSTTHFSLFEEKGVLQKEIQAKERTKTEYQAKILSGLRFRGEINKINSEIKLLKENLLLIERRITEEKAAIIGQISCDPNLLREINNKIIHIQEQAKKANVNLYSTKDFFFGDLNIIDVLKK